MNDVTTTIQGLNKIYPKNYGPDIHHTLNEKNLVETYVREKRGWVFNGTTTIEEHNEIMYKNKCTDIPKLQVGEKRSRTSILKLLKNKEINNRLEEEFLDEDITHFELIENEETKKEFVGIVHDDYLIFKCWSGRTSAITCVSIISHISTHSTFFTKTIDNNIYLLIRVKGAI